MVGTCVGVRKYLRIRVKLAINLAIPGVGVNHERGPYCRTLWTRGTKLLGY